VLRSVKRRTQPAAEYTIEHLRGAEGHAAFAADLQAHYVKNGGLYSDGWFKEHPDVFGDKAFSIVLRDANGIAVALTSKLAFTVPGALVFYVSLLAARKKRAHAQGGDEHDTAWVLSELGSIARALKGGKAGLIVAQSVGYQYDVKEVNRTNLKTEVVCKPEKRNRDEGRTYWLNQLDLVTATSDYSVTYIAAQLAARPGFAESGCAFLGGWVEH